MMNRPNAFMTLVLHSLANMMNIIIRSVYPVVPMGGTYFYKLLNRLFSPLDTEFIDGSVPHPIISIFWSNSEPFASHSTNEGWL